MADHLRTRVKAPEWRLAGLVLAGLSALTSQPGAAQVFEVGGDGSLRTAGIAGEAATGGISPATDASGDAAPDVPAEAITPVGEVAAPLAFRQLVVDVAAQARVSPDLLAALVWQESRWHVAARSSKGATGLAQLMPATARALSVDPRDPAGNLTGAATYLRQLLDRFDGNVEKALAAYNAGPARVDRANGVPAIAETRAYVAAIADHLSLAVVPGRP